MNETTELKSTDSNAPQALRLLRRVPLATKAMAVALICGLLIWFVLDNLQARGIAGILDDYFQVQLNDRAREVLTRFDRHVSGHQATGRLLARDQSLLRYVKQQNWQPDAQVEIREYLRQRPMWFPRASYWRGLIQPSHIFLLDGQGRTREIYQVMQNELPESLRKMPSALVLQSRIQALLTLFDDKPYLLISEDITDAASGTLGTMVVIVPVNNGFMQRAQQGMDQVVSVMATGDDKRVIVSSAPEVLPVGRTVAGLDEDYLLSTAELFDHGASDLGLQLITLLDKGALNEVSGQTHAMEREQLAIAAGIFVLVFLGLILFFSWRINRLIRRVSAFSEQGLGLSLQDYPLGDQLTILEERIGAMTEEILRTRENTRKRHEDELKEREALRSAILNAALDCVIIADASCHIVEFNPASERTFARRRADVLHKDMIELLFPKPHSNRIRRGIREYMENGEAEMIRERLELSALRSNGSTFPAEIVMTVTEAKGGPIFTIYLHDISDRKRAEREIHNLAKFPAESPSPVLRVNAAGVLLYSNKAAAPLMEHWGIRYKQLLPPYWRRYLNEALGAGTTRETVATLGERYYSMLIVPFPEQSYVNIYAHDITAMRAAEQRAMQHQADLVHVSRLSTMGEMTAGLAHELNNPLAAIANYANGITRCAQTGQPESEMLTDAMEQISSQANRASAIIRKLRGMVQRHTNEWETTDINSIIAEAAVFAEFEARKSGVVIEQQLCEEPTLVAADVIQIQQVLINLIRNALDAMSDLPRVRRRLRILSDLNEEKEVEVLVQDTGPGIKQEVLDQVFDPFFTTKTDGIGIGLAISRTIIENHRGRLWASSHPGEGASFRFTLPLADGNEVDGHDDNKHSDDNPGEWKVEDTREIG